MLCENYQSWWKTAKDKSKNTSLLNRTNIERLIDSTRDHSNKNNLETAEATVRRCSSKWILLKILQYSQ